ncbi:hypothetical protein J2Z23_000720 [Lederbergia galactosidilyticus]|nr:hypothetical protein [Lederbergia galactosidilytica]
MDGTKKILVGGFRSLGLPPLTILKKTDGGPSALDKCYSTRKALTFLIG